MDREKNFRIFANMVYIVFVILVSIMLYKAFVYMAMHERPVGKIKTENIC